MFRVQTPKKQSSSVWTNTIFCEFQDGTLPTAKDMLDKKAKEPEPEPKTETQPHQEPKLPNQEPKPQQVAKYQGQKNRGQKYQASKWNQGFKGNQGSKGYQNPRYLGTKSYQGQKAYQGQKSYQGPNSYQGPKAYQGPRTYQGPRIYQGPKSQQQQDPKQQQQSPKEPQQGPKPLAQDPKLKYKDYKVPEISVNELCRTLVGLQAISEKKNNPQQADNKSDKNLPGNEPFFASNLQYYPHLPQVFYSQQYQTFADLKASVCEGNLTQVKPPADHDYRFVQEWRSRKGQSLEDRQAYLRNQRALNAQRLQRDQEELGDDDVQASGSNQVKPPPMEDRFVKEWRKTCEDVGRQRELRHQQEALNAQRLMREQHEQEMEARRQEVEARRKKEEEQQQQQQQKEKEQEEAEARRLEQVKFQAELRNRRARNAGRIGREFRLQQQRRDHEFRHRLRSFDETNRNLIDLVAPRELSKMPAIPLPAPPAPLPSELPQPLPSILAGVDKTISGSESGYEATSYVGPKDESFYD